MTRTRLTDWARRACERHAQATPTLDVALHVIDVESAIARGSAIIPLRPGERWAAIERARAKGVRS